MKKILVIFFVLMLFSCATTSEKAKTTNEEKNSKEVLASESVKSDIGKSEMDENETAKPSQDGAPTYLYSDNDRTKPFTKIGAPGFVKAEFDASAKQAQKVKKANNKKDTAKKTTETKPSQTKPSQSKAGNKPVEKVSSNTDKYEQDKKIIVSDGKTNEAKTSTVEPKTKSPGTNQPKPIAKVDETSTVNQNNATLTIPSGEDGKEKTLKTEKSTDKETTTTKPQTETPKQVATTKPKAETPKQTTTTKPKAETPKQTTTTKPKAETPKQTTTTKPQTETPKQTTTTKPQTETPKRTTTTKPQTETPKQTTTTKPQVETPKQTTTTKPQTETPKRTTTTKPQTETPKRTTTTKPQVETPKQTTTTKPQTETPQQTTTTKSQTPASPTDEKRFWGDEMAKLETPSDFENANVESEVPTAPEYFSEFPQPDDTASETIPVSRTVSINESQRLRIVYPGEKWVFLGEQTSQKGLNYEQRKFHGGDTEFTFHAKEPGNYILNFSRYDAYSNSFIKDAIQVKIGDRVSGSPAYVNAPDYILPTALAEKNTLKPVVPNTSQTTNKKPQTLKSSGDLVVPDETLSQIVSNEDLLEKAKKQIAVGDAKNAISNLNKFLRSSTDRLDEAYFYLGQAYELNGSEKNIKEAYKSYKTVTSTFIDSDFWQRSDERMRYIKRFFVNIE